jgi:hypothetical protein
MQKFISDTGKILIARDDIQASAMSKLLKPYVEQETVILQPQSLLNKQAKVKKSKTK